MCSNLSKQEDEFSHAIEQVLTEFIEENLDKRHTLAYATKIECSKKKAVYQVIPEFWLRKIFPGYIYANINTPEKRFTMMSNQKGISNLPDESMEILKKTILGRYNTRHVNCTHAMLFITCAMLSFYSIISYHLKIITMTVSLKSLLIK